MIPSEFAERLLRALDDEIISRTKPLADGSYHTIETYQRAVGERRGLVLARDEVVRLLSDTAPDIAREHGWKSERRRAEG